MGEVVNGRGFLYNKILDLLLASVAWSMTLLAGHPQSALIVAYISTTYLIFRLISNRNQSKIKNQKSKILYFLLPTFSYLFIGLALSAIQFIPAVEYTLLSVRANGVYDKMSGGFPLIDLIQFLLPRLVSHYSPWYVGLVGLILAGTGIQNQKCEKENTITAYFFATVGLVSFLISFGGNSFLYSPLYLTTPGFSIFRGQERWAFATVVSLSVLAGYGFRRLLENSLTVLRITQYLFFFTLFLAALSFYGLNDTGWKSDNPFYGLLNATTFATLLLALIWLLWRFSPGLSPRLLTALTALIICFDLFTINWQTNLYPQLPEWHSQMATIVQAIKQDVGGTAEPFRVYNEFRLYDNYGVPFELEDLWGASPLRPSRYDEFLAPPMPIERVWELLNVKYVITWRHDLSVPSTILYQEAASDGTTYVHRLNKVMPRAWLVQQAKIADNSTILSKLADPTFDRWHIALFETTAVPFDLATSNKQQANTLTSDISRSMADASHLSYHVTTSASAWLILSETYYPGWQATVDGQATPILPVDYLLRAIPLSAGEHTIDMSFHPLSFTIGAFISVLAIGAVIVGLLWTTIHKTVKNLVHGVK